MNMLFKTGKVLWKLFWAVFGFIVDVAFANEKPVCGPAVARQRLEDETITYREYKKATRNRF